MRSNWQQFLDNRVYPGATRNWDDVRFTAKVRQSIPPNARILDFGAGRGKDPLFDFRDSAQSAVGVDVDEEVLENQQVHEKHVISTNGPLPFKDNEFDLIFCANVLEHVGNPTAVFTELSRVLKPGGRFMAKTTNKNHYVALAARLTPFRFHQWYNKRRGREEEDTFHTTYQCNSEKQIQTAIANTDLSIQKIEFWEGRPEYLRFSTITYLAGIAYEKGVNLSKWLRQYRAVMVVVLEKKF